MLELTEMSLWCFVTFLIGFNVLNLLDKASLVKGLEAIGISFMLGIGTISIQLFIMGICDLRFERNTILMPWYICTFFNLFISKAFSRERFHIKKAGFIKSEKILLSFLSFEVLYTFFRAVIRPMESYDSIAIYALKSKMVYLAGTIPEGFFHFLSKHFHGVHPDYPLLVSLAETWVYIFINNFNDFLSKCIFPLTLMAFLLVFFSLLKKVLKKRAEALFYTFILGSIAQFNNYATIGSADLHMGIHFCLSLLYLYLWFDDTTKKSYFYLSLIFSIFAIWTKNEGILLAGINLFLLVLFTLKNWRGKGKEVTRYSLFYLLVIGAITTAWLSYRYFLGIVNENFDFSMIGVKSFFSNLNKIPLILYEYQKHVFGFKKWNLIWIIMLVVFIKQFRKSFVGGRLYITGAILLFFISYSLVYIFSAVEIRFLLRTTTSRFLLHILPVCVFWIACMLQETKFFCCKE